MRYVVDVIAKFTPEFFEYNMFLWRKHYVDKYVVINRLSFPHGLAFPGGGIEAGEDKVTAVMRECKEETGFSLSKSSLLWLPKVYDEPGRDPRGAVTSYVAYGRILYGAPQNEKEKTEVLFLSKEEILARKYELVFDHFQMFLDYLNHIAH